MTLPTLYETMRVREGEIPFLAAHHERLNAACDVVGLMRPPPDFATEAAAHALRAPADRMLRVEWNGAALVWEDQERPPAPRVRVALAREPHPGYPVKSTERAAFDRATKEAEGRRADEALLLTREGVVAETPRYAVAWFVGEMLQLPSLEVGILPGVGRRRLLELAAAQGMRVGEGTWRVGALTGRPLILVNAASGIVPVATLEGRAPPKDARIAQLAEAFWPSA